MMIRANIIDFFFNTIQYTFANGAIENYVFDVYVDKNERVWLVDFNVWAERTDPLLFKWEEIIKMSQDISVSKKIDKDESSQMLGDDEIVREVQNNRPEIRVVMNGNEVLTDPLSSYRAPIDTVDLASETIDSNAFEDFMAMCQPPSAFSDSDNDDDS